MAQSAKECEGARSDWLDLYLARSKDGSLQVIWNRQSRNSFGLGRECKGEGLRKLIICFNVGGQSSVIRSVTMTLAILTNGHRDVQAVQLVSVFMDSTRR